jgi:hypothetical protein
LVQSFGRLRVIDTNGTFYAWACQALIGLALFIAACSSWQFRSLAPL